MKRWEIYYLLTCDPGVCALDPKIYNMHCICYVHTYTLYDLDFACTGVQTLALAPKGTTTNPYSAAHLLANPSFLCLTAPPLPT